MAEEIQNSTQEENLIRKVKSKRRIRGLLIAIDVLLIGFFAFELVSTIIDRVSKKVEDTDIISLNGNSRKDSLTLYNKYVLKDENDNYLTEDVYDYGIYGDYLHLSNRRIDVASYSSYNQISLINVSSKYISGLDITKEVKGNYLDGGIKLSSLEKGDYLLFSELINIEDIYNPHRALKIRSAEGISETIYSLPDKAGKRKKIQIKSKDSSPCLVISVSDNAILPKTYYDFVIMGNGVEKFENKLEGLTYYVATSLQDAFLQSANYFLYLDENNEGITSSYYLSKGQHGELYGGDSIISKQDKNEYIRELGGYLTSSGSCLNGDDTTFVVKPYLSLNQKGKLSLIINPNETLENIYRNL